ncbi:MAG: hypothetical protein ACMUIG_07460 [Thermoplasmatota archaeon]
MPDIYCPCCMSHYISISFPDDARDSNLGKCRQCGYLWELKGILSPKFLPMLRELMDDTFG